jgi:hypothetical protein
MKCVQIHFGGPKATFVKPVDTYFEISIIPASFTKRRQADGIFVSQMGTSPTVVVSINAPDAVSPDSDFQATVDITSVVDLNGAEYEVIFNPAVLRLDDVTEGLLDSTSVPVTGTFELEPGRIKVLQHFGTGVIEGSGYLAKLCFHSVGAYGDNTTIEFSDGILSRLLAGELLASWVGDYIEISFTPGDANEDGVVNVLDMTKVARIILQMDPPNPAADCNQDSNINVLDMTCIARKILGLD